MRKAPINAPINAPIKIDQFINSFFKKGVAPLKLKNKAYNGPV